MPTRGVEAVLAAACLFLFARLGRAGALLFCAPVPVAVSSCARCTGARQQAGTASIVQLSAWSESWAEEDEVVCDRILSSIERAHARPDARLEHDDEFVRAPKDGELFDLMQSVLLKVARPPLHVVCVACRRAVITVNASTCPLLDAWPNTAFSHIRSRYVQVDARESIFQHHNPRARDDFTPQSLTQAHDRKDKGGKTNVFVNSVKQALLRLLAPVVAPPQKMDTDAALAGSGGSSRKGNAGETWQLLVSDSRPYVVRDILPILCGQQVNVHTHIVSELET